MQHFLATTLGDGDRKDVSPVSCWMYHYSIYIDIISSILEISTSEWTQKQFQQALKMASSLVEKGNWPVSKM